MKKLVITLLLVLLPTVASAETLFTTPEVLPDIDRFRVEVFTIDAATPEIIIQMEVGYAGFNLIRTDEIGISNGDITRKKGRFGSRQQIYKDDINDEMLDLPVPYRLNPATKIITEVNSGTFGGQATMKEYVEVIVKTLLGL